MYKLMPLDMFGNQTWVMRLSDYAQIQINGEGPDVQAYLAWLEEGNTPLPADEVTA